MIETLLAALTIQNFLSSPYYAWFPVAAVGTLAVIGILAIIAMFSAFVGRERVRVWSRIKMYEVLLALMLAVAFFAIITVIENINFVSVAQSVSIVPNAVSGCNGLGTATDLTSLAVYDMYTFNCNIQALNTFVFVLGLRFSFVPQINFDTTKLVEETTGIEGVGVKTEIVPVPEAFDVVTGYALDGLYTAFVFSQIQLLLLAASLLIFSILMTIGLLARIFVVTRSFGGAMIAFAIGIGLIYPMMVSITYGYVDVGMQNNYCAIDLVSNGAAIITGIIGTLVGVVLSAIGVPLPVIGGCGNWINVFFNFAGYAGLGLILIPVLNFIIVDVFILDFSQAIGERMDFMSLIDKLI